MIFYHSEWEISTHLPQIYPYDAWLISVIHVKSAVERVCRPKAFVVNMFRTNTNQRRGTQCAWKNQLD